MEISPLNFGQSALPVQKVNNSSGPGNEPEQGVVIKITPSDDNVSSGDRSQNSAQLSISTPNNDFSTEITREEFFNSVERRAYQNAYGPVIPGNSPANPNQSPETASLAFQQSLAQTYAASYSYSSNMYSYGYPASAPYGNTYPSQASNGISMYNQAMNSYVKQTLFFSAIA